MEAVSFADMPAIASLNFFAEEMNGGICDLKYCRVLSTPVSPGMLSIKANPENITDTIAATTSTFLKGCAFESVSVVG
jgi:hypothetical protein